MLSEGYCADLIVGGTAHITGDFYNSSGDLADPSVVHFYWITPTDLESTNISGHYLDSDPELVNSTIGRYYVDLPSTEAGKWTYRWVGTGVLNTATEGTYNVKPSDFTGRST